MKTPKFTIVTAPSESGSHYYSAGYRGAAIGALRNTITEAFADAKAFNADPEMLAELRTLRFWVYINGGYVRLTLPPGGKVVGHVKCDDADGEGFSRTVETWQRHPALHGYVLHEISERGRDCDGGYSRHSKAICAYASLAAHHYAGMALPYWVWSEIGQHDHRAEAAGY